jgi:hypothetical protein
MKNTRRVGFGKLKGTGISPLIRKDEDDYDFMQNGAKDQTQAKGAR